MILKFCVSALCLAGPAVAGTLLPTDRNAPPGSNDYYRMLSGDLETLSPKSVSSGHLFESDIVLTDEQYRKIMNRKATSNIAYFWPARNDEVPLIPFAFGDENVDRTAVRNAIAHWEEHTCLKFEETEDTNQPRLKFVLGTGCWSYIGMVSSNSGQEISIGKGCTGLGVVIHEIGHALGFYHEQSRSDRDQYIDILYENIIDSKEINFQSSNTNNYFVPYDYLSDMHYSDRGFTSNGGPTIATKNPLHQGLIGKRTGLSHYDKLIANTMYPCIETWLSNCSLSSEPCQNHGYTGKDCNCVCRSGTSGTHCENVDEDYYASSLNVYSEIITAEGPVTSPNYPASYPADFKMTKWIQAPECHTVKLTFSAFKIYGKNDYCNGQSCCYFEILDIRTDDLINGNHYCDTEIAPGTVFESSTNEMVLYFVSRTSWMPGWSANINFVPTPGCNVSTEPPETTTTTTTTTPEPTTTTTTPEPTTTTTTPEPTTTTTTPEPTTTTTTPEPATTTTTSTEPIRAPATANTNTPTCNTEVISDSKTRWTSIFFGQGNYPNDRTCSLSHDSNYPSWARITYNDFALQERNDWGDCLDSVTFTRPYLFTNKVLCGRRTGEIGLPSSTFMASFLTDDAINNSGFDITITKETSDCHLLITTGDVGDKGTIYTPRGQNYGWVRKACEWWIRSPVGTKIQLTASRQYIGSCRQRMLIVNSDGDPTYPADTTKRYCGWRVTFSTTSDANEMNAMFFATYSTNSVRATWSVIAA